MTTIKVHLIEDDTDDIFLIRDCLKKSDAASFQVSFSKNLRDGIDFLNSDPNQIVLLDLSLPDNEGLSGLQRLKSEHPNCCVIILTGLKDYQVALSAVKSGATDYLIKGEFNSQLLARALVYAYERRNLETQLLQSQKVEALGQLAGGIAHDFNNQLSIISLLISKLEYCANNTQEVEAVSRDLHNVVEKCGHMTQQILGFSRKQSLFPSVFQPNELLERVSLMVKRLLGSSIDFQMDLNDTSLAIKVDPNQLEQALWNLIINARDALGERRKITLSCRCSNSQDEGDLKKFSRSPSDLFTVIEVSDSGEGIASENLKRIFDPFFTTKPRNVGTGLGLAMVYGFVQQSGGIITAHSKPGEGSKFKIFLPASHEEVQKKASKISTPPPPTVETGVLICDDEPALRDLIASSMEERGYKVFTAEDGVEGLKAYKNRSEEIHLVITDLTMPRGDGIVLISNLQELNPNVKCLIMSGFSEAHPSDKIKYDYVKQISKPFSMTDLLSTADTLLRLS